MAKTKRYPYARLSRLATHALLHFTEELLEGTPLPPAAWLLGFRKDSSPMLKQMKESGFPLISRGAQLPIQEAWVQA